VAALGGPISTDTAAAGPPRPAGGPVQSARGALGRIPEEAADVLARAKRAFESARQKQREYESALDALGRALDELQQLQKGR